MEEADNCLTDMAASRFEAGIGLEEKPDVAYPHLGRSKQDHLSAAASIQLL